MKENKILLRHEAIVNIQSYIQGEPIGEAAIRFAGVANEHEYRKKTIKSIMGYSGLSFDDVRKAINDTPDALPDGTPNPKQEYLDALEDISKNT